MASFLSKLFGGGTDNQSSEDQAVTYNGCQIIAAPEKAGGQWRLAGRITKEIDGDLHERAFIRADLLPSREEAATVAVRKAKQIIDEQGERLFAPGSSERV